MRTSARALVVAAVAAPLLLALSPAAHAVDEIELSSDGRTWAPDLTTPLFDPAVRWVPGDVRRAQFFLRTTPDRGDLRIEVLQASVDTLIDTGSLAVSARIGSGPWTTVTGSGTQELAVQDDFEGGVSVPVVLQVAMAEEAPNDTMVLATDLDFRLRLTAPVISEPGPPDSPGGELDTPDEAGGVGGAATADPSADSSADSTAVTPGATGRGSRDDRGSDDGDDRESGADTGGTGDLGDPGRDDVAGVLPDTGNLLPAWLPPLGLLLLGAGAYLVTRRRHLDHPDHPDIPDVPPTSHSLPEEPHHV